MTRQLLTESLAADNLAATCAPAVASAVREWRDAGYPSATDTTKRLLEWWFDTDHEVEGKPFAFYDAQREAVESLIYVYEVMKRRDNRTLLEAFLPNPDVRLLQYGDFARYGVKMATGSGKTMVMALCVAWSYLNAVNEPDCDEYATSFLIIAPNVIVFERLQGDFAGGSLFRHLPIIPPEYSDEWGDVRFFMRGDRADLSSHGAVYLTNVQQLYDAPRRSGRRASGPPVPIADLLGPTASDMPDERDDFDDRIVRRRAPLMVINDEAHHTHDEDSAWNQTIRGLRERLGGKRFMAQLDFSATPRFNDGTLFPWTIYDYPLRAAIEDGIVKQPIRGEISGAGEVESADASVHYGAYITAAVNRWQEYRDQLKPLNKRPVLFAMLERSRDADNVGEYLRQTYPAYFGDGKLQVIHTNNNGEFSTSKTRVGDLQKAREIVKDIDSDDSAINAVISVMMLREGWDVRNVTVVLGLRPYSSKANILPEQAIGRGLRLMFPGEAGVESGYRERVDIIGTEKFMEFVADLEKIEDVALPTEKIDQKPIVIVSIYPDTDKIDMDIAIPNISPAYERRSDTREEISKLNIDTVQVDNLPFSLEAWDDTSFEYLGLDALTDEELLARTYQLPSPNTCGEVISYYATRISRETNLPGHFDIIVDKLREFFARRAFGQPVDLEDNSLAPILARPGIGFLTVQGFARAIRPLLRQELEPVLLSAPFRLSDTEPFPWSRPTCLASKTVFNLVAADNEFEAGFARFLESAPDIVRFAKIPLRLGFKIQYIANTGNIRHYYPDFVAVGPDRQHYLIETKGMEDTNVANKDRAANIWCANASTLTGIPWRFVKVAQIDYSDIPAHRFADIVQAFSLPSARWREMMVAEKSDNEIRRQMPEWLEKMGGESVLIEGFIRAEELHKLIEDQYHDLVEKYPDRWIAMPDSGEAIVAESTKELLAKLDELGIDRSDVARRFIRAPGRKVIRTPFNRRPL